MSSSTLSTPLNESNQLPNPIMVSRQIDGLREVLRRMRATETNPDSTLIAKKLEQLAQS